MIAELAAAIPDGATVALAQDSVGVAMAATRELVRRGVRDLDLVGVPISGLQADVLIGAGCVRSIETSAMTLGEFGTAPRFAAALKAGTIQVRDSTCPAIHAALQAGQKGLPFMPLRGLLGTDLVRHRPDWKVIDNPFGTDDPIVLLPAIRPHFGLFHAPLADRQGNVWIGRQRDLLTIAQASQRTLVTVEAMTDEDLLRDESRSAGVIPAIYVTQIALAPGGAKPLKFVGHYARDEAAVGRYAAMARTEAGFREWLDQWLQADAVAA